jgi:hypothetical protein
MTTKQATLHLTRWQSVIEQWEEIHDQLSNLTGGFVLTANSGNQRCYASCHRAMKSSLKARDHFLRR